MTDQPAIPTPPEVAATQRSRAPLQPFQCTCIECQTEFTAFTKKARYCGQKCRRRHDRRLEREQQQQQPQEVPAQSIPVMEKPKPKPEDTQVDDLEVVDKKAEKKFKVIRPKFQNLPADVGIAVGLLERELDRMEAMYQEERIKRKKIQGKYQALKDTVKDERHASQLAGIEAAAKR